MIQKALKRSFSPEFLNRIDRIVTFNALGAEDIRKIVELELDDLDKRLRQLNITVSYTDATKAFLADKGYDPQYGARPLRRAIAKYVEDLITQEILDGNIQNGGTYIIDVNPADKELGLRVMIPELSLS